MIQDKEKVLIRTAVPSDSGPLKNIAADTAYFGQPCENFFPDRELLAELIMEYYVGYEPEHTWVAEYHGEPVGYLSACFDEKNYSRKMLVRILPQAVFQALRRGKIWDRRLFRMLIYNIQTALKRQSALAALDRGKHYVHIHQNIRDGLRGMKIGTRLLEKFLEYADENRAAVRFRALRGQDRFPFFEKYGFVRKDVKRVRSWEQWLGREPLYFMEYVREKKNDKE